MKSYCGKTANVVNADQPTRWVHECITAVILRELQPGPPRNPCGSEQDVRLQETPYFFTDDDSKTGSSYLNSFVSHI